MTYERELTTAEQIAAINSEFETNQPEHETPEEMLQRLLKQKERVMEIIANHNK